jgi:hypothetical protein
MFDINMLLDNLDNNQQSVSLSLCPTFPSGLIMLGVVQSHFGALSYWPVEFFGGNIFQKTLDGGSIEGLPTDEGGGTCVLVFV